MSDEPRIAQLLAENERLRNLLDDVSGILRTEMNICYVVGASGVAAALADALDLLDGSTAKDGGKEASKEATRDTAVSETGNGLT